MELRFGLKNGPILKMPNEKNKLKNKGMKIKAAGIRTFKFSSNVKELIIQCMPLK